MATLAIEIVDSTSGEMAEEVRVQVRKIVDGEWKDFPVAMTDVDGHAVLFAEDDIKDGGYFEILVCLGEYFDQTGHALPQYKMIDIVPLRFGVETAQSDITLRMSATPNSYSTNFSTQTKRLDLV